MNNKPLKDLDWFSFTSDLNKLKHLSIFQTIAYIMRNKADLESLGDEYERLIHKLEVDSADELYEEYGETTDQYSASNVIKEIDYLEICIPGSEVKDDLTSLNDDRIAFTIDMGAPVSIIYYLLQSEINKYQSDPKKVTLKIMTKSIAGFDTFYFCKKDLKDWKSLSTIKELGLLDANLNPKRKSKAIKEEYELKITGMLIYLLANQPLKRNDKLVDFTQCSSVTNISALAIYDYFKNEFLYEDESDKDLRTFPAQTKVTTYLNTAFEKFNTTVNFKIRTEK